MKTFYKQHLGLLRQKYLLDFQEARFYEISLRVAPCTKAGKAVTGCGAGEAEAA